MSHQDPENKTFIVLGGGSAGWMCANILAHSFPQYNIELIEDPDIPSIGVGEGSTPALKSFFELLGVKESEWMQACDATYKNGILFNNWIDKPDYQQYFHAFPSIIDNNTLAPFFHNARQRVNGLDVPANPSDYFLTANLAQNNKVPIPNENFPFDINYAYHFDSAKLAGFLRGLAESRDVKVHQTKITSVQCAENGNIQSLSDASEIKYSGDMFFDCSGFKGVLSKGTLQTEFVSYGHQLLNDSAAVIQVPTTQRERESQTVSTALSAGWRWSIPLQSRYGYGYVYSSSHISKEQAEKELLNSIPDLDTNDKPNIRHLSFSLGRLKEQWNKNCVAVGLSQGFIEPLEATALMLIQQTVGKFTDLWLQGNETDHYKAQFNAELNDMFDGIKDYVLLHYKLSNRTDSSYWLQYKNDVELPERLQLLVSAWQSGGDFTRAIKELKLDKYYPISSWYSIFAGSGVFPDKAALASSQQNRFDHHKVKEFVRRCALNYKAQTRIDSKLYS